MRCSGIAVFCTGAVLLLASAGRSDAFRREENEKVHKQQPLPGRAVASVPPADDQVRASGLARRESLAVKWDRRLGTPRSVRGRGLGKRRAFSGGRGLAVQAGADHGKNATAVLDNLSRIYGIADAAKEFQPRRIQSDKLGFHHARMTQRHRGLKVTGGELIVHFDDKGDAVEVNGRYVKGIDIDVVPHLAATQATAVANAHLKTLGNAPGRVTADPELEIFAIDTAPRLAYALTVRSDTRGRPGRWRYWIDAQDGDVLLAYNDIQSIAEPTEDGTNAVITGNILTREGGGLTNTFGWHENAAAYYMYDKERYWYVYSLSGNGPDSFTYAYRNRSGWGASDPTEMSMANNFAKIQTYFLTRFGRQSYDGSSAYACANVHEGYSYANAYWDGEDFHFGDGDGYSADSMVVMDVAGHEFTHAVTENTADLIYADESGALNESFSDILGTCVEFAFQPDGRASYPDASPGTSDWLCGEDCWVSSTALRDLRSPTNTATVGEGNEQPSRYMGTYWHTGADDNGGVHYNSGVQNFFFYLLSEGGSGDNDGNIYNVTGIGYTNAEQVAYRALTVYCTPSTDYGSVRGAWLSAAADLNPAWVGSVDAAWSAAGIQSLEITPSSDVVFRGPAGGPFVPATNILALTNNGDSEAEWSITCTQDWLTVDSMSGIIRPLESTNVAVSPGAGASGLANGVYAQSLIFSNGTEGARSLTARILVGQPDYVTEWFGEEDNDLQNQMFTFTPDGGTSFYSVRRGTATVFPTDPAGGTFLNLRDDTFEEVVLDDDAQVTFFGVTYRKLFIGSNGYITFGSGDDAYTETLESHFSMPRIAALFWDLNPSVDGTVSWKEMPDRVAITFFRVPEYYVSNDNSFQIEIFYGGTIRLTYLDVQAGSGLVGLSQGLDVPADFLESDFSAYPLSEPWQISPHDCLRATGYFGGPFSLSNVVYSLTNSDVSELQWTVGCTSEWLTATPAGGTLAAGGTADVTVALTPQAALKGVGTYAGPVLIRNAISGAAQARNASLDVKGEIRFDPSVITTGEGASAATVNVCRAGRTNLAVTVRFAANNETATAGSDYTATNGTLSFAPGETLKSFRVEILNDVAAEGDETVQLSLSDPTGGGRLADPPSASLVITDDEAIVAEPPDDLSIAPTDGFVFAGFAGGPFNPSNRVYALTNNGAFSLPWTAACTSAWLSVMPAGGTLEPGGTTTVAVSLSSQADLLPVSRSTGTIRFINEGRGTTQLRSAILDARGELRFITDAVAIGEGEGTAPVSVCRDGRTNLAVTVRVTASDWTATAGSDYTATNGIVAFAPGETLKSFHVKIQDDAVVEYEESLKLTLTDPTGGAAVGSLSNATVRISDDDAVHVCMFFDELYVDTSTFSDGEGYSLKAALEEKGCVVDTFEGITDTAFSEALAGVDILCIPELESGDLAIDLPESTKSVISNFVANGGGMIICGEAGSRDEELLNQVFGYGLTGTCMGSPSLLSPGTTGTAFEDAPSSLSGLNGTYEWLTATLPAGSMSVYEDAGAQYTTVAVIPQGAGKVLFLAYDWYDAYPNGTQDGGWDEVLADALREANTPNDHLSIAPGAGLSAQGVRGGPFTPSCKVYALTNSGVADIQWTAWCISEWLAVIPADGTLAPGRATNVTAALAPPAELLDIGTYENTVTFSNTLSGVAQTLTARLLVKGEIGFDTAAVTIGEGGGSALINVRRDGMTNLAGTVDFAAGDGTAAAGSDYTATNGTLEFAPGETLRSFRVEIRNDVVSESNETVELSLSNPTGGELTDLSALSLTIVDNEGMVDDFDPDIDLQQWSEFGGVLGDTVYVSFGSSAPSGGNSLWFDDDSQRFAVSRAIDTRGGGTISFYLSFSFWSWPDLPEDGVVLEYCAEESGTTWTEICRCDTDAYLDWTLTTLDIPPGAKGPAVRFRWRQPAPRMYFGHWQLDDVRVDTVVFDSLSISPTSGFSSCGFIGGPFSVSNKTYTLTNDGMDELQWTVGCASEWLTATPAGGTLAAGGTADVTVALTPQAALKGVGTYAGPVLIRNAISGAAQARNASLDVKGEIRFDPSVITTGEGASAATVNVCRAGRTNLAVTVRFAANNETATAGSDYTATNGTLSFAPGETLKSFRVEILNDVAAEGDETVHLSLWGPTGGGTLADPPVGSLIIVDDEALFDDFDPDIDMPQWSEFGGTVGYEVLATNRGGFVSGPCSLWFGGYNSRFAATRPLDTRCGGTISFHLRLGNSTNPWEMVDLPAEGVALEYCTEAGGTNWTEISRYATTNYCDWTGVALDIPAGARSDHVRFRWYQSLHGGPTCDHWALDDVMIDAPPFDGLSIEPAGAFSPGGCAGGPFSPYSKAYMLTNSGQAGLQWMAGCTSSWVTVTPAGGTLAAGGSTNVTVALAAQAALLGIGTHVDTVTFDNVTSGTERTREVQLAVRESRLDHFSWDVVGPTQRVGHAFPAKIFAKDAEGLTVAGFDGTAELSGWTGPGNSATNILGNAPHARSSYGNCTVGYAFTPSNIMTVTHVRHYFGTRVSIWTDSGTLLASQDVTSALGVWTETELAAPVQLLPGNRYVVGLYTGSGTSQYYWRTDGGTNFIAGVINEARHCPGDAFPTNLNESRWWLVDLRYSIGQSAPVSIAPTVSGSFSGGTWTGMISVTAAATNMYLRAGTNGDSGRFDVLDLASLGTPVWWLVSHRLTNEAYDVEETRDVDDDGMYAWQEYVADTCPTSLNSRLRITGIQTDGGGLTVSWQGGQSAWQYIECCASLGSTSGTWTPVYTGIPPTSLTNSIPDSGGLTNSSLFYRIRVQR